MKLYPNDTPRSEKERGVGYTLPLTFDSATAAAAAAVTAAVAAGNDKNSKNYEPDEIVAVKKIAKASHSIISFSFIMIRGELLLFSLSTFSVL